MSDQVEFVAEVSSNHNQSLERSLQFIDAAAEIGCSAVKFQLFRINQLFAPEILEKSKLHRDRINWELPLEFIPELSAYTHEKGMQFCCTPFDLEAVELLEPWVDFFKIASYELLWSELLIKCAETAKPLVVSTGMATMEEVVQSVEALFQETELNFSNDRLMLLHCVSGYPTPVGEANLSAIETIREVFGCKTGWSDHTVNPGVIHRAVHRWGASMVEFHLDIDGQGDEYKAGHCWLPEQIKTVINQVSNGVSADGNGVKAPLPIEEQDRMWRADPEDGLRPLKETRLTWLPEEPVE